MQNYQVATELLCRPGVRMTNKERKQLNRARWKELNPKKFDPLGIGHRLEYRLGQRSWQQLCKWQKRANARRKQVQCTYIILQRRQTKLGAKTGQPSDAEITELLALNQGLAALDAKARVLDTFLEGLEEEVLRRKKLWESVATAGAQQFAKQLRSALTK